MSNTFSAEELAAFRNDTTGCAHVIHLNNAGAALMPDPVTRAIQDHIALEARIGGYEAAKASEASIAQFYTQTANLLHCTPENIAFTTSATDSFIRALSSIPFRTGDVILTDNDNYISNQIQFLSLQKRQGIRLVRIKNAAIGGVDLADLEEQLYRLKPRLLAITHIPTNSGLVQPVEAIAGIYHRYTAALPGNTWYILDACQSIGQVDLDVKDLKCDFLTATSRKFLRGPRGAGFLYVSTKALQAGLEPLYIDMRGAQWIEKDSYRPRETAMRYEDWEFAYALVQGTRVAIEYCLAIGLERIHERVWTLAGDLRGRLAALPGVRTLDRGPQQGGLVTFTIDNRQPEEFLAALAKRAINVVPSYREFAVVDFDDKGVQWAIRASPHYYNTSEELATFVETLGSVIEIPYL
jgi:selenocysteine lyase/cysteine desulfurase